ncbi:alpha/beta fold hydrolase [Streptomyces nigra]
MKPITPPDPARAALTLDGRRLSYLNSGGPGHPLLALHGHFSEGRIFAPLARALLPHRAPTRTALAEQLGDSARYPS